MKRTRDYLSIITILLLAVTAIGGILSMDFTKSYEIVNQYGQTVQMYGAGLYQHDTYFKAPINIGSDFCVLFVLVPMFLSYLYSFQKTGHNHARLKLIAVYGISFYYAASYAFGVTYNHFFLIYLLLFSCSLFGLIHHILTLSSVEPVKLTQGLKIFLLLSGIALIVAWFPDIIPTLVNDQPLSLIGVYTTEITYVLDMGLISPLCFLCIYLLHKKKPLGTIVLAILLKACSIVGIMMITQTILQLLSHAEVTLPALLTKSASFFILAFFAYYFERKLYQQIGVPKLTTKKRYSILFFLGFVVLFLFLYWKMPYSPSYQRFYDEQLKKTNSRQQTTEVCTKEEIDTLPEPLQRYCNYVGVEGFPKYQATRIQFHDTDFVMDSSSGKTLSMDYDLWLFQNEIERIAYCSSSFFGVPFDGIDYSKDKKQGGMKGILGKLITIFDETTEQGYQAGLISWIAEGVAFNPSFLFSPQISYEEIDNHHVKVTMTNEGVSGSGIFTINDEGAITEFYSEERQVEKIDGVMTPVGWKCLYNNYKEQNGIKTITKVDCIKELPQGDVVYFASDDFEIHYLK